MTKNQLDMVQKMKEVKDGQNMEMLDQFLTLLASKDAGLGSGLPQFLSFLGQNKSEEKRPKNSTIPRPSTATNSIRSRKASITSQTVSISSRSTTPETPNRRFNQNHEMILRGPPSRTGTASLASIPSSGN